MNNFNFYSEREKNEFLTAVFNAIPDFIFLYNTGEHTSRMAGQSLGQMLGYSKEELEEMGADVLRHLVHSEDLGAVQSHFESSAGLGENQALDCTARLLHASGHYHWLNLRQVAFRWDASGNITTMLGITRDVTEKMETERQLEAHLEQIQKFSFITSHELRHEFSKMMSLLNVMQGEARSSSAFDSYFRELYSSASNVNRVLSRLSEQLNKPGLTPGSPSFPDTFEDISEFILIDDDPVINKVNSIILQKTYPQLPIRVFENTDDGLHYIRNNAATGKLIFLDLNFPEKSGWDFMDEYIKEAIPHPVIILSSSIDAHDMHRAGEYEIIRRYMPKPLTIEGLLQLQINHSA